MADKETPMMGQYRRMRRQVPDDTILFFRLGDFYEMFFDDAARAAKICEISLTKRNKIPMCGVPYHMAEVYLSKLIKAGVKVAVCEQMEDPRQARGIVKREITRIVTPGTILEENILDANRNNYLAGLCFQNTSYGLALLDLSTGTFWIEEMDNAAAVGDALSKYTPSECVMPEEQIDSGPFKEALAGDTATLRTPHHDWTFEYDAACDTLTRHFNVHSMDGFGCEHCHAGVSAAGAVLHYVARELNRNVDHVRKFRVRNQADYMVLDESTVANLELVGGRSAGRYSSPTLLSVLDAAETPMGSRLLREWLLRPLASLEAIRNRHEAIQFLTVNRTLLRDLREILARIKDLERLIARLNTGSGNARDLRVVVESLRQIPKLRDVLPEPASALLDRLREALQPQTALTDKIDQALEGEPPATIKEGGLIRKGYHEELDTLREAATEGRRWLAKFQTQEQQRTGIKSLKVRHNKVFGYYIEITKSYLDQVPEQYTRKQTLANAERFITPKLKEVENKILGAQERSMELEYELFVELRAEAVDRTAEIQASAQAIASVDVLAALADRALCNRYVMPAMNAESHLVVKDGRHPVVEQLPDAERFVPNDTLLDNFENQLIIITGPNMAGKSTYIRQVALLAIMAQMGSFVPAAEATVGVIDRVFTRVGASDDLARGRSTFMVEMQETANILNNATAHSLIVLDEIGRGTSTFDGISIAWAVAEFLHNNSEVKAKTLFATHYHELTDLARTMPGVKNYNVQIRESGDSIAFLRRIVLGAADKSYGIHVAKLAGLPPAVIDRASEILDNLEEGELNDKGQPQLARQRPRKCKINENQLSLF